VSKSGYPARNDTEPIENPAQAWNAITVGAYTEKTAIADTMYAGWEAVAPAGELSPTSRTSLLWERQWPIKPDILLEGGNWAALDEQFDCPDNLGLLTTFRDPGVRHFDVFRDTSAATALAGNLAGRMLAQMPERWPETIRALMIHSAEWTDPMKQRFAGAGSEQQKRALFRRYGYGVPSYARAVFSSANDLTLIAEDELQPFWKDANDGVIKTRHMNLHEFPWPRAELEQLGATEVELRVTLSITSSRIRVSGDGCDATDMPRTNCGSPSSGLWNRLTHSDLASTRRPLRRSKAWEPSIPVRIAGTWDASEIPAPFTPTIGAARLPISPGVPPLESTP
jgi:hypothetical protein